MNSSTLFLITEFNLDFFFLVEVVMMIITTVMINDNNANNNDLKEVMITKNYKESNINNKNIRYHHNTNNKITIKMIRFR